MYIQYYQSPLGWLRLVASATGLQRIDYVSVPGVAEPHPILDTAIDQLEEYFSGDRQEFELDFDLIGTEFQKQVWWELCRIPYQQTISYAELAQRVGRPKAFRAVGNANGKNPIPIIIPCHRVIASNGRLGGYSGGIDKKTLLLRIERLPVSNSNIDSLHVGLH